MESLIHLSQSQLSLLENCPPRFQQIFLDQLSTPLEPEQVENTQWGSRFHQLMQQKKLNLAVESLLAEDQELFHSLEALIGAVPEIREQGENLWQEAEHHRTLQIDRYLLTVVYDLLIAQPDQAQILDWKTYPKPITPNNLRNHWQTRLYLYVLAETSSYLPEQITMTYWFVKLPKQPEKLTFKYNQVLHEQTKQDLSKLLNQFSQWLEDYWHNHISFPHLQDCENKCEYYKKFQDFLAQGYPWQDNLNEDWGEILSEIEEFMI